MFSLNVFDIQQGVAISVLWRAFDSSERRHQVRVAELWGESAAKYDFLSRHSLAKTKWTSVELHGPEYGLFVGGDGSAQNEFDAFPHLQDWFPISATGFITHRDELVIDIDKEALLLRVHDLANAKIGDTELISKYSLKDNRDWQLSSARTQLRAVKDLSARIVRCTYRPFDSRWCWWGRELMDFPRPELSAFFSKGNTTLLCKRQNKKTPFSYAFVTAEITESCTFESAHANNVAFPLFVPSDDLLSGKSGRRPNVGGNVVNDLKTRLGLLLVSGKTGDLKATCGSADTLHYVYAILYSTGYRTRYEQCLIKSFPRLPLTSSLELFRTLSNLGGELVTLHLMESPKLDKPITKWKGTTPSSEVEKITYADETVWIDKAQTEGFRGVAEDVWNFHIGGYQVCEKWLKDRRGRKLSADDITHYQKIVVALNETIRLMGEIDEVIEKHGGWPGAFVKNQNVQAQKTETLSQLLPQEEFIISLLKKLRKGKNKGIHSLFSGFNGLFKEKFPGDKPQAWTKKMAEEGTIVTTPISGKGKEYQMIYLPEDAPKN